MRILVIGRGVPNSQYPLNGIFEYDQAKALAQSGNEVIYIGLDLRSFRRKRDWGIKWYIKDKLEIIEINIPCGRVPKDILFACGRIGLKYSLYKYLSHRKIDIVHAHFSDIAIIASKVFKEQKDVKFIITEHSSEISEMNMRKKRYLEIKNAYKKANLVLAVSKQFCGHIEKAFNIKVKCVKNIVDTSSFEYREVEKKLKPFVFVVTARLSKGKRIDLLLDAFQEIVKKDKNVNLYIIGDGEEKQYLQSYITNDAVKEKVVWFGQKNRTDIAGIYSHCHCFVLPSESETFGVAYIEAMACGLPVIATKCGGPEDFINSENGLLIQNGSMEALCYAMLYIIENYSQYDYKMIAESIKTKYKPETVADNLCQLYSEVY